MTTEPRFGRVLTAMVTPFAEDGSLDLDGAATLARWLVEQGNDALVVVGTTGEAPTLTHDEQIEVVAAVVEAVDVPSSPVRGATTPDRLSGTRSVAPRSVPTPS